MNEQKKPAILILISFFLLPGSLFAKQQPNSSDLEFPKRFRVGDMYYASSFRGLNLFMVDLEEYSPDLHEIMSPEFERIRKKKNTTLATLITSGALGTALVVSSFTIYGEHDGVFKPGDPFYNPNQKKPNIPVLFSGIVVYAIGGLIGLLTIPDENDIYRFVNTFNRNSPGRKMDWEIGLGFHHEFTPGLRLTLNL
jgi:hypothetical protein